MSLYCAEGGVERELSSDKLEGLLVAALEKEREVSQGHFKAARAYTFQIARVQGNGS
jgi:hypothetical protein